jgi:hypothetical protein
MNLERSPDPVIGSDALELFSEAGAAKRESFRIYEMEELRVIASVPGFSLSSAKRERCQ